MRSTEQSPLSERVVVAMSGGVDSSVAAALLVQRGYQVIGMMMRLWSESGREADNRCCTPDAMAQARRVARILGIPFYVIDAKEIFHKTVVTSFVEGYAQSITPNPCLLCNRWIRWDYLLKHALAAGAQKMATGHYVRIEHTGDREYSIRKALDFTKDQSYVLHVLGQEQLRHALFPLGNFTKLEVRRMALEFGLPVADRPDSQDLCFLSGGSARDFLRRNIIQGSQPGPIVDGNGKHLGEHEGLAFYTIGQRKGLGLATPEPLYVLAKEPDGNRLVVGTRGELGVQKLTAAKANWISGHPPDAPFDAQIKIRYKAQPAPGQVTPIASDGFSVNFEQPLRDITPGQAAVIYKDDYCLGGGIIQS